MAKPLTQQQLTKEFFKAHTKVLVTFHWRRDQLSEAYRECLDTPRSVVAVKPKAVSFDTALGRSELSLDGMTSAEWDRDTNILSLSWNAQNPYDTQIIYRAI